MRAFLCACGEVSPKPTCDSCKRADPYRSKAWRRMSREVIARDRVCQLKGVGGECSGRLIAHHIQPRRDGGPDVLANLAALCHAHHSRVETDLRTGRDSTLLHVLRTLAAGHG